MSQHCSINSPVLRILNWSFRSASGSMYGLSSSSSYPIFIHLSFIMIYEGENSNEQIIFRTDSLPSGLLDFSSPSLPVFLPWPFSSHPSPTTPSCPSSPTHSPSPLPFHSAPSRCKSGMCISGSLTSKLALFVGFSTRNFFNKFSQSAKGQASIHISTDGATKSYRHKHDSNLPLFPTQPVLQYG